MCCPQKRKKEPSNLEMVFVERNSTQKDSKRVSVSYSVYTYMKTEILINW